MNASPVLPGLMIVDDDPLICEGLAAALGNGFEIHQAGSRAAAIDLLRKLSAPPQLALIDLGLPPTPHRPDEGFHLIAELLAHSPEIRIFVLSGQDEQGNARHARALGATDFIAKPCIPERIRKYLDDALATRDSEYGNGAQDRPLRQAQDRQSLGIVGQSPAIQALRSQIAMYAAMPYPVLIEGESGCGKELVAAALQKLAGNPEAPFKVLNCAAISPTLIEPTLFGHSKGAFTGATSAQSGFFEDASGGTLFLDEIGELPLELQTKLLRVLENGEYQRIGETATRKSRARIIAATNRNLRNAVRAGAFRDDLYHRLNVFSITVPPLRELGRDKLALLDHFRAYYARQTGQAPFELCAEALQRWECYSFPGNTRELRNIVIRLTAKYAGQTVSAMQLQEEFDPLEASASEGQKTEGITSNLAGVFEQPSRMASSFARGRIADDPLRQAQGRLKAGNFNLDRYLREQESHYIAAALELAAGNISEAARLLGINRTTLHSRMDAHEKLNS